MSANSAHTNTPPKNCFFKSISNSSMELAPSLALLDSTSAEVYPGHSEKGSALEAGDPSPSFQPFFDTRQLVTGTGSHSRIHSWPYRIPPNWSPGHVSSASLGWTTPTYSYPLQSEDRGLCDVLMKTLDTAKAHPRAAPHAPRLMLALQEWLADAGLNDIAQTIQIHSSERPESPYNVSDTLFQHSHTINHNVVLPVPGTRMEQPQVPTLKTGIINPVSLPSLSSLPRPMKPDQGIDLINPPIQTATGHSSLSTVPSLIISPLDLGRIVNSTSGDLITPSFPNDPFVTDAPLPANASISQGYCPPSGKALEILEKLCEAVGEKLSAYAQRSTEDSLVSPRSTIQERSMPLSPSQFPQNRMDDLSQLLSQVEPEGPQAVKDLETFLLKYSGNTLDALGRVAGALLGSLRSGKIFYVEDDVTASSVIPSIFSNGYIIKCRSVGPGSGKREYLPGFCGKQKCNPCGNQKWRPLQDVFECIVKELLPNKSCGFVRSAITDAIKARKICEHTKTTSTFTLGRLPRNQVPRAPGNAPLYLTTV